MPPNSRPDWTKDASATDKEIWKDVLVIKDVDAKNRLVKACISTDEADSDGERIRPESLEACGPDFLRRGFVSYMHSGWAGTLVGEPKEFWREGTAVYSVAKVGRDYTVPTPFGFYGVNDIWSQVEQGILKCTSIGGRGRRQAPDDENSNEPVWVDMTSLWEWSFVPRGANPSGVIEQVLRGAGLMPKCPNCAREISEREEQVLRGLSIEQLAALFDRVRQKLEPETVSAKGVSDLLQKWNDALKGKTGAR